MKNEYSNGGLSFFLRPRIHGNVLAWNKPASGPKARKKQRTENILRWEDDGGPVSETGTSLSPLAESNAAGRLDVDPKTT